MADFSVGDLGSSLIVQVVDHGTPLDMASATGISFHMKRPDGTAVIWTPTVMIAGTWTFGNLQLSVSEGDGLLLYTTSSSGPGDWTIPGEWQGRVLFNLGTWSGRSTTSFAFLVAS